MPTVKEVIETQPTGPGDTRAVRGLSLQIIAEMNLVIPNVLVSSEDLNIEAASSAVNLLFQPAAKEALRRAIKARGGATLKIDSAYRTVAQQHLLRSWFEMGSPGVGGDVARPSLSNHEDGGALDTPDYNAWISALENEGWEWYGSGDEWHFSYTGAGFRNDIGNIGVKAFQQLWNKNNPSDQITADGIWGWQTAARLNSSPAEGFGTPKILKLTEPNMQGEDVRKVQQALVNAGFLTAQEVDGFYRPSTKAAVEKFQENKGLAKDGVVGPQTRRLLGLP